MRIALVGPGRAGISLALAAAASGHDVAQVAGRSTTTVTRVAEQLGASAAAIGDPVGTVDLLLIAVRDDAIEEVAQQVASSLSDESASGIGGAVHLSGLKPVTALAALGEREVPIGSYHPLQTLPTPDAGAARLVGSWAAITADGDLRKRLHEFAASLAAEPFDLEDAAKPTYHAAAAAAANFPLAALTMASDLFAAAGVPFDAARALVEAVTANAFEIGPRAALTGPVARGDTRTVATQLEAVMRDRPDWTADFARFVTVLARLTGRGDEFAAVIASTVGRDS